METMKTMDAEIKRQVREFYNQVGWKEVSEGVYQNAHYEDLRPVSSEYINRCHSRVTRHLKQTGKYLLDAGSGPIQYPAYLEYSEGYQYRVCVDISLVALQEARKRIGDKGLFVVADIANLPFVQNAFDGVVSLHTVHHLPIEEHKKAYSELYRVLAPQASAVVVNGWSNPLISRVFAKPIRWVNRGVGFIRRKLGLAPLNADVVREKKPKQVKKAKGTYVQKNTPAWFMRNIKPLFPMDILVWRSINVRFMRTFIHARFGGRLILKWIYWLEEQFPRFWGKNGQYPLVVIHKRDGNEQS